MPPESLCDGGRGLVSRFGESGASRFDLVSKRRALAIGNSRYLWGLGLATRRDGDELWSSCKSAQRKVPLDRLPLVVPIGRPGQKPGRVPGKNPGKRFRDCVGKFVL